MNVSYAIQKEHFCVDRPLAPMPVGLCFFPDYLTSPIKQDSDDERALSVQPFEMQFENFQAYEPEQMMEPEQP
jgi:hypothetical protein